MRTPLSAHIYITRSATFQFDLLVLAQLVRFANLFRIALPVASLQLAFRLDSCALQGLSSLSISTTTADTAATAAMLLQGPSHTVQAKARPVSKRALQPVARIPLFSTALKTHTTQASLRQQPGSSSGSSSSHSSECSSGWSPRSAVTTSAAAEAAAAASAQQQQQQATEGEWSVLNFYHLVDISDPDEVMRLHFLCL